MNNFTITCKECFGTDVSIECLENKALLVCNSETCKIKSSTLESELDNDEDKAIMLEESYSTKEEVRKVVNKRLSSICQNHLRHLTYKEASELDTMRLEVIAYLEEDKDWRVILIEHRVRQYESLFAEFDNVFSVSLDDHFGLATIQKIKETYNKNLTVFKNMKDEQIAEALVTY